METLHLLSNFTDNFAVLIPVKSIQIIQNLLLNSKRREHWIIFFKFQIQLYAVGWVNGIVPDSSILF